MRKVKVWIFAVLGVLLAAAAVLLSFWGRTAQPKMLLPPEGARQCCIDLLDRVCAGDYAGASRCLYGTPSLDAGQPQDSAAGQLIWDAFLESLNYELAGECYPTVNGLGQRVQLRSLCIPNATADLSQRAQALLEQQVEAADEMADIYDENLEYQESFLQEVLLQAAAQCVAENGQPTEQDLMLNLVYDREQWWVVPDAALLSAISGGILGNA